MMRRISILLPATLGVFLLAEPSTAHATQVGRGRNFGLGIQLGSPTAFTGKYFMGRDNALDFGLGSGGYGWGAWRCRDSRGRPVYCDPGYRYNDLGAYADYLWQDDIVRSTVNLDWHIGVGGLLWFVNAFDGATDTLSLVARMPIGLDLTFNTFNTKADFLEVFFEIVPGLVVLPPLSPEIDAGLGVRFFF